MRRNLAVGHFYNEPFIEGCDPWKDRIREVFFAWPGVLSCRPAPGDTPENRERLFSDLRWCRSNGILLDTLFNCNCYGDEAISIDLARFVRSVLEDMDGKGLFPDIVTTTSPFIATVIRRHFPGVKIRWSVNGRVHGTVGFEYVDELFDSFYLSRERQREFDYVDTSVAWARAHGKVVGMQVNSGCLRQCPFQQFHDNLHGHGDGRRPADVAAAGEYGFSFFRCMTSYSRGMHEDFIRATWVRPEDVPLWEERGVEVFKIATRRISNPTKILAAYAGYSYDGNLLDLMDPVHSRLFPAPIDNKSFPEGFATSGIGAACANDCSHCGRCASVLSRVMRVPSGVGSHSTGT